MKVHPSPHKRNITAVPSTCRQKKLRRLPHVFSKVLELPFYSDADVTVQETSDSLKFVVNTDYDDDDDIGNDIGAHTVEICPGVLKVVVRMTRGSDGGGCCEVSEMWRFRLPEDTMPELATASFSDGELVVIVPKVVIDRSQEVWSENNGTGQFVLVQ